jgi:hypothetical protein
VAAFPETVERVQGEKQRHEIQTSFFEFVAKRLSEEFLATMLTDSFSHGNTFG